MREAVGLGLLLLTAACVPGRRQEARLTPGVDLGRYRRLAVLPFSDRAGEARAHATAVMKALYETGFDMVPLESIDSILSDLHIRPGEPLGPPTLAELRRLTKASAVVLGTLECGRDRRRLSVVIVETAGGRTLFDMTYAPEPCSGPRAAPEAAARVAARVRRALEEARAKKGGLIP